MGTAPVAVLALFCLGAAPAAPLDRWAPGVADSRWALVAGLQAWPGFRPEPPDWEAASRDPEPVVRAAAAAALGRGRPSGATRRLQALVQDESELVRTVALWALLQSPDESAREPLRQALSSWVRFDEDSSESLVSQWGPLFRRVGLPPEVVKLRRDARLEWLSRFDGAAWQMTPLPGARPGMPPPVAAWLSAARSEWDADEGVDLQLTLVEPGQMTLGAEGWRELGRPGPFVPLARPSLRTLDGVASVSASAAGAQESLRLGGDPALLPGTYVLARVGSANPLFFRVRRSRSVEASLPSLLSAARKDLEAVQRLGDLRVKAAAPTILRLWREASRGAGERLAKLQGAAGCGNVSDRESAVPLAALLRLESPEAVRELLEAEAIGEFSLPDLAPLPELTDLAEAQVVAWRDHLRHGASPGGLATLVRWPGLARRPAAARAVDEIAAAFCSAQPPVNESAGWVARAALETLATVDAGRATDLLVARLRQAPPEPLLVRSHLPRQEPAFQEVLRRAFEAVAQDATVPAVVRSELAAAALPFEQPLESVSIPAEALDSWLWRAVSWYSSGARIDQVARVVREALARQPNATAQVVLAELERRRGHWDESLRLAREALPRLPKEREGYARSVAGMALAARGETREAGDELAAARATRWGVAGASPNELQSWLRNLETRPEKPGLRIRYAYVGSAELRAGGFRVESAHRLRFTDDPGRAGDLVAVTPTAPLQAVSLGPRRVALLLAGGSAAAYDAAASTPVWRADTRAATRLTFAGGVLLADSRDGVRALDAESGRQLWVSDSLLTPCAAAAGSAPAVLAYAPVALSLPPGSCCGQRSAYVVRQHDARTGAALWEVSSPTAPVACASDDELLVFVELSGVATAVERASGRQLWRATPTLAGSSRDYLPQAVALSAGGAPVFRQGNGFAALDRQRGSRLWSYEWKLPPGQNDSRPEILVAPGPAETWLVAGWNGRDQTRYLPLHEVVRLDSQGRERERLMAPAPPQGGGLVSAALLEGQRLVVRHGSWDETWEFGDAP